MMTFGTWLKLKREQRGLTLKQLESLSGTDAATICGWEHNRSRPTKSNFESVLRALDTTPEECYRACRYTPSEPQSRPETAFNRWFREKMREQRMSPRYLAREVGVHTTTIWRWQCGWTPAGKNLDAVLRALNTTYDEFCWESQA